MGKKQKSISAPPTKATVKKLAYRGEIRDIEDLSATELLDKLQQKIAQDISEQQAPTETSVALPIRIQELQQLVRRLSVIGGDIRAAQKRAQGEQTKVRIKQIEDRLVAEGKRVTNKTIAKAIGGMHPDHIRRIRKRTQGS